MPIPEALVGDIRQVQRRPQDWFSFAEITKRDPDLEVAARYVQTTTGKELVVRRNNQQVYEKLEDWAARLLEHEVRSYEQKIWELCSENSFVPTSEDDERLRGELTGYIDNSVRYLKDEVSRLARYTPDIHYEPWSKLKRTADRLHAEMSVTIGLAGEISRLETADSGHAPVDRIGYAQIKIERFLSTNYSKIPHPFAENKALSLSPALLQRVVRLVHRPISSLCYSSSAVFASADGQLDISWWPR